MNRSIIYATEQGRSYDYLIGQRDVVEALGQIASDILGQTSGFVTGLAAEQTSPATLQISIGNGGIYQYVTVDPTPIGTLPASTDLALLQGIIAAQLLTLSTTGLSAGQKRWALVEVQFAFQDIIRPTDPNNGILPFNNPSNPSQPYSGPGNTGTPLSTERLATGVFQIKYGTAATAGSEVPPTLDSGWIPLFLIDISASQTQILTSEILVAGPSVGVNVPSNYPQAPFIAGQLNQHHKGTAGQAPQIDLTAEVRNVLPLVNLPSSSNSYGGLLPVLRTGAGSPSGSVAGNVDDLYYDTSGLNLYIAIASGNPASWATVTTTAGATPTGNCTGIDVNGSYPNSLVVIGIHGMPVDSGAPSPGDLLVVNPSSHFQTATPSGDVNSSAATPGLLTVIGLRGVPIKNTAPSDGQVPIYVSADGEIEWGSLASILSETDAPSLGSDKTLTISGQTILSAVVTIPAGLGKYRIECEFNVQVDVDVSSNTPDERGLIANLTDGTTVFGRANVSIGTNNPSHPGQGICHTAKSPAYAAGSGPITVQLVLALAEAAAGSVSFLARATTQTYMKCYLVRSN